jgi:hypothetical protein
VIADTFLAMHSPGVLVSRRGAPMVIIGIFDRLPVHAGRIGA